jgi:hypothetical protein
MIDIYDIALLIPVGLLILYWWRASGQKDVAVAAARAYCKDRQLQLLDETLVFTRFRMEQDARGRKQLCRQYTFDFCRDGTDRHSGEIVLRGYRVLRVILHGGALEITEYSR